jgi:hypothetical protein
MSTKANPEAVVLGALFDFAGHLRTSDIINPLSGIDGFAKLRKLSADEVLTLTWREQLDSLRDQPKILPTDSELVSDLVLLADAFQDADPSADNHVFDVLNNAALRLRQVVELVVDLELAAETLRRYEVLHRAKGTTESTEKAEVNAALAFRFESTIKAVAP